MDIFKYDLYGGPNVGIYAQANNEHVFLPRGFAKTKAEHIEKYLGAVAEYVAVANTRLIGTMMVMNNKGALLPNICTGEEIEFFKEKSGLNVGVLSTKYTALGNMICVNDKGAALSPLIGKDDAQIISDVMGVEIIHKKIAGYHQTGAVLSATSQGGSAAPLSFTHIMFPSAVYFVESTPTFNPDFSLKNSISSPVHIFGNSAPLLFITIMVPISLVFATATYSATAPRYFSMCSAFVFAKPLGRNTCSLFACAYMPTFGPPYRSYLNMSMYAR